MHFIYSTSHTNDYRDTDLSNKKEIKSIAPTQPQSREKSLSVEPSLNNEPNNNVSLDMIIFDLAAPFLPFQMPHYSRLAVLQACSPSPAIQLVFHFF